MNQQARQFILVALFAVLSLGSAPALSQDTGWYVGFNIGQSKAKDACTGATTCDDSDTALGIFAGYQINRNFAVEFGYTDLGKATASGTVIGIPVTASVEARDSTLRRMSRRNYSGSATKLVTATSTSSAWGSSSDSEHASTGSPIGTCIP